MTKDRYVLVSPFGFAAATACGVDLTMTVIAAAQGSFFWAASFLALAALCAVGAVIDALAATSGGAWRALRRIPGSIWFEVR